MRRLYLQVTGNSDEESDQCLIIIFDVIVDSRSQRTDDSYQVQSLAGVQGAAARSVSLNSELTPQALQEQDKISMVPKDNNDKNDDDAMTVLNTLPGPIFVQEPTHVCIYAVR